MLNDKKKSKRTNIQRNRTTGTNLVSFSVPDLFHKTKLAGRSGEPGEIERGSNKCGINNRKHSIALDRETDKAKEVSLGFKRGR